MSYAGIHPLPPPTERGRFALVRKLAFGWFSFWHSMLFFVLATATLPLPPRPGRVSYAVVQMWSRLIIGMTGCRLRVENAERWVPDESRMIVANHCSWYDPPAVWQSFPGQVRFVLKKELTKVPFIGWYSGWAGHFLLDRANPREGMALMKRAIERAHKYNLSPVVFPEGTRSPDGKLKELRAGAFQLAISGKMSVQPVAILGSFAAWPKGFSYVRRCREIVVRVGEPIDTTPYKGSSGRKQLAAKVRQALIDLGVPDGLADEA